MKTKIIGKLFIGRIIKENLSTIKSTYSKISEIGTKNKKDNPGKIKEIKTQTNPKINKTVDMGTTKIFVKNDDREI